MGSSCAKDRVFDSRALKSRDTDTRHPNRHRSTNLLPADNPRQSPTFEPLGRKKHLSDADRIQGPCPPRVRALKQLPLCFEGLLEPGQAVSSIGRQLPHLRACCQGCILIYQKHAPTSPFTLTNTSSPYHPFWYHQAAIYN